MNYHEFSEKHVSARAAFCVAKVTCRKIPPLCKILFFSQISQQIEAMKMCQATLTTFCLLASVLGCQGFRSHSSIRAAFVVAKGRGDQRVSKSPVGSTRFSRAATELHVSTAPCSTPQANPTIDEDGKPLSGISHEAVLSGLDRLYPPQDLQMRNAASRTDGYWAFVSQGEEPPMDLTYGEFDFHFFAQVLDRAHYHYYGGEASAPTTWNDKVMMDIGSGMGRLVLGAAALYPEWKECRGVELLQGIHDVAVEKLQDCTVHSTTCVLPTGDNVPLSMAPVTLSCGSFEDPDISLNDMDCAFAFSSCFTPDLMERLGQVIGRQCKPGSVIITTDYMLPLFNQIPAIEGDVHTGSYQLELAEKVDGWCWLTGGSSTAYIHRVVDSLAAA